MAVYHLFPCPCSPLGYSELGMAFGMEFDMGFRMGLIQKKIRLSQVNTNSEETQNI